MTQSKGDAQDLQPHIMAPLAEKALESAAGARRKALDERLLAKLGRERTAKTEVGTVTRCRKTTNRLHVAGVAALAEAASLDVVAAWEKVASVSVPKARKLAKEAKALPLLDAYLEQSTTSYIRVKGV